MVGSASSQLAPPRPRAGRHVAGHHGTYTVADVVLAHGGRAAVHEIIGGPFPLVYKAFKEPHAAALARPRLGRLVLEGRRQFVERGRRIGACPGAALNWPVDVVADRDRVFGVVLPRIPPSYERPNGTLRTMEFLLLHRGEVPASAERVAILIRLAELLGWLARRGLVHGDLAPRNVLWTTHPRPEVVALDVDGIHDASTRASEHVATPGWTDPRVLDRVTDRHDQHSDWYALALFMYRGLLVTPGMLRRGPNGWPGPTLPPEFFPAVRTLLVRALADPLANDRPSPDEWVAALLGEFFPAGAPNWEAFARLDAYVAARREKDRTVSGRSAVPPTVAASAAAPPGRRRRWWRP